MDSRGEHEGSRGQTEYHVADDATHGVNERDIADLEGCEGSLQGKAVPLQHGRVYRSSQVLSEDKMKRERLSTILDLREMDRPCKLMKLGGEGGYSSIKKLALRMTPTVHGKDYVQRILEGTEYPQHASRISSEGCLPCSARFKEQYGVDVLVHHAALLPKPVKLRIFAAMPFRVKVKALAAPLHGRTSESVMAPAIGDTEFFGYAALYKLMLDRAQSGIAQALRVFVDPAEYPILVLCIHGKDRTGLVIALLLLLLGVPETAVVANYAQSEVNLRDRRASGELPLQEHMTLDEVTASEGAAMEETLAHLQERYGGAEKYARMIGLTDEDISSIRNNLLAPGKPHHSTAGNGHGHLPGNGGGQVLAQ